MTLFHKLQRSSAKSSAAVGLAAAITVVLGTSCLFNDRSNNDDHDHDQQKEKNNTLAGIQIQVPFTAPTLCERKINQPTSTNSIISTGTSTSIPSSRPGTKLLFLGSGSSTGCPKPIRSLVFAPTDDASSASTSASPSPEQVKLRELQNDLAKLCNTSKIASICDPKTNKNYRNNPSLLISHRNSDDDDDDDDSIDAIGDQKKSAVRNVIIDVGKTFREGAIRWMPHHGIYSIDGIVLTHEHADAMLGLDDLRGFQISPYMMSAQQHGNGNRRREQASTRSDTLPIYLSEVCMKTVKQQFGYLVPKEMSERKEDETKTNTNMNKSKKNEVKVVRAVASLDFRIIQHFQPFVVAGLKMIPLPVLHGEDLICNGYAFSVRGDGNGNRNRKGEGEGNSKSSSASQNVNVNVNVSSAISGEGNQKLDTSKTKTNTVTNVVYLSDISRMIPETEQFILEQLPPTDILVVDTLRHTRSNPVHFNLNQALELIQRLKPKKTYIVGINCDDFPEHDKANAMIQEKDPTINVKLAYDGLAIEL